MKTYSIILIIIITVIIAVGLAMMLY